MADETTEAKGAKGTPDEGLAGDETAMETTEEFERSVALCEGVLKAFDLDPGAQLMEGDDESRVWGLRKGSANILLIIRKMDEDCHLHVVSPILALPELDLEPFYRRLLELNHEALIGCAFAVRGDQVCVTSDRMTWGLDDNELEEILACVADAADRFDDELAEEFDAEMLGSES